MEVDVEYKDEVSGYGFNFDHIPTPELCCALCQADPKCQSFTWVKDAGLVGCPSQCWIKGGQGTPVPGYGKVSGLPPPRPTLPAIPAGHGAPYNSMFCFSLMMPFGGERNLLAYQYQKRCSIFSCDGYAVYSNMSVEVVPGYRAKVVDSNLQCKYGGDSMSALNAWIFIAVWDKVIDDAEYRAYKWVCKVDPDAVFLAHRLVPILQANAGAAYLNNCRYGLHGPIEVFSASAIDTLAADYSASYDGKAPKRCVEEQHFGQWGEDMFINQCLGKVLGVKPVPLEPRLCCEDHCDCPDFFWCRKGSDRVSYHPFKTVGAYETCLANALLEETGAAAAPSPVYPAPAPVPGYPAPAPPAAAGYPAPAPGYPAPAPAAAAQAQAAPATYAS